MTPEDSEEEFLEAQAKAIREHVREKRDLERDRVEWNRMRMAAVKRWCEEPWPDLSDALKSLPEIIDAYRS